MAAETEAAGHGGEAASGGLPQFDPTYFPSQLFWLAVFFVLLYLLLDRALLPKVGGVIKQRADTIQGDIDTAAKANEDAHAALAAYEQSVAAARHDARDMLDKVRAEANAARAEATAKAEAAHNERLTAAEARISARRAEGLASAQAVADEVAEAIVAKIVSPSKAA